MGIALNFPGGRTGREKRVVRDKRGDVNEYKDNEYSKNRAIFKYTGLQY